MIFKPRFPRFPPQGRIDDIIYWGVSPTMANWLFWATDLDTNQQVVVPQADLPSGPPSGAAGGDLSGTYPNPAVAVVSDGALSANVPIMTAGVLPAVDGSLLTNLPVPLIYSGRAATLDGGGQFELILPTACNAVVATWYGGTGVGQLKVGFDSLTDWFITSSAGGIDSGLQVAWIAF